MEKFYLDAGTTYSKIIVQNSQRIISEWENFFVKKNEKGFFYVLPSKMIKSLCLNFTKTCGHMGAGCNHENEIIALAKGAQNYIDNDDTVLDMGSRDAKWIKFVDGKFKDMDWNTSCASSTGATVEMLLKFYDINVKDLDFTKEKFPVTCGIFGLEKIMDDISNGIDAKNSISKFVHGIAYNAWSFTKKPEKIYLSGGFCDNKCFVESLSQYCEVVLLGRFVLCEGLLYEK